MTTLIKLDRCRRYYLGFLTWYFQDEEKARQTLEKGAEPIPMPLLKLLIRDCAINGRSAFAGTTGWSLTTARSFVRNLDSMRRRHHTVQFTPEQTRELLNFVEELAKVDKSITTMKRVKRFVREVDLLEIFSALLSPNFQPAENYTRIQMTALTGFVFMHGIRIGTVVQNSAYTGLGQYLKWGDTEWLVTGWQEGTGISIQIFFKMRWMKNMRMDESAYIQVTSRSLPRKHLIFCHIPFLLAMAITNDVFEEDLSTLGKDRARVEALTASKPYRLVIKTAAQDRPLFTQRYSLAKKRVAADDGSVSLEPITEPVASSSKLTPREQVKASNAKKALKNTPYNIHPMTASSADHMLEEVALVTGHKGATFSSMRIGFSRRMLGRMPNEHFKYLFGHGVRTEIAGQVYQTPDRPIDITSIWYGIDENNKYSDLHSSVSWDKEDTSILPTFNQVLVDPEMTQLLHRAKILETTVSKKFGCSSKDVPEENLEDQDVIKAIEAYADVVDCYSKIISGSKVFSRPALPMSIPPPPLSNQGPLDMVNDKLRDHLESRVTDHPYRRIIDDEPDNPTSIIVAHCLSLIEQDKHRGSGICEYCFSDPDLSPAAQTKNHSNMYSIHFWACEEKHNPDFWRNPITGQLIQHTVTVPENLHIDKEVLEIEEEDVYAALKNNRDSSHAAMLERITLPSNEPQPEQQDIHNEDEDKDKDEDKDEENDDEVLSEGNDETGRSLSERYGRGCYRLSCATKIGSSRRPFRRFFCPICFFGSGGDRRKHKQREGDDDSRFVVFLEAKRLAEHLISDWAAVNQSNKVVGGINYNKTFTCGFPECKDLPIMKTGRMISHLHNVHEYNLVECSLSHDHSPGCYELPEKDFLTITDARLMESHLGKTLPTTNLTELRRRPLRKTQEKKILQLKEKMLSDSSMTVSEASSSSFVSESLSVSSLTASSSSSFSLDHSF